MNQNKTTRSLTFPWNYDTPPSSYPQKILPPTDNPENKYDSPSTSTWYIAAHSISEKHEYN